MCVGARCYSRCASPDHILVEGTEDVSGSQLYVQIRIHNNACKSFFVVGQITHPLIRRTATHTHTHTHTHERSMDERSAVPALFMVGTKSPNGRSGLYMGKFVCDVRSGLRSAHADTRVLTRGAIETMIHLVLRQRNEARIYLFSWRTQGAENSLNLV